MRNAWHSILTASLVLLLAVSSTGCVTSKKYKMVKKEVAQPPAALNWGAGAEAAGLTLQSVIVFKGPGSWKREARWDEYVVTLANPGASPLVIEEAVLTDPIGQPQVPGEDPWKLEKISRTNWDKYGKTGLKLLAGAGAVALYGTAVAATAVGSILSGGAAAGGAVAVLTIIPVVAILDIAVVAVINNDNKKKIVAEFNRRRLALPLTVAEGQSVTGSFFFPMTPSPKRLVLRGRSGSQPVEWVIDLKPLADLHLKPADKKKATSP